jgi:hypothetical protein
MTSAASAAEMPCSCSLALAPKFMLACGNRQRRSELGGQVWSETEQAGIGCTLCWPWRLADLLGHGGHHHARADAADGHAAALQLAPQPGSQRVEGGLAPRVGQQAQLQLACRQRLVERHALSGVPPPDISRSVPDTTAAGAL